MSAGPALVRARRLSAGYGARTVLRSISLEARPGRSCAVLGPGGGGKSTLLLALAGAEAGGEAPWTRGLLLAPRNRPGFLPQRGGDPDATLALRLSADGHAAPERLEAFWRGFPGAAAALAAALEVPLAALPARLRRLAEFTAVAARPCGLLLLDEPDAGLGAEERSWLAAKLRGLRGERTVVMVTHHLGLARAVADDVLLLIDGAVVETGDAGTFFERPVRARTRDFVRLGS